MYFKSSNVSFGFGLSCALLPVIAATYSVPQFERLFMGFGTELPALTKVVIEAHYALWLLPIIVLLVRFLGANAVASARRASLIGIIGGSIGMLLLVAAMYKPIFQMGSVV